MRLQASQLDQVQDKDQCRQNASNHLSLHLSSYRVVSASGIQSCHCIQVCPLFR